MKQNNQMVEIEKVLRNIKILTDGIRNTSHKDICESNVRCRWQTFTKNVFKCFNMDQLIDTHEFHLKH